jgi:hypothetical protein
MVDVPLPTPRPPPPLPRPNPLRRPVNRAMQTTPLGGVDGRLESMARTAEQERAQEIAPVVTTPGGGFQPWTTLTWTAEELAHLPSLTNTTPSTRPLIDQREAQRQEEMDALLYPPDPREIQRMQMTPYDVTSDPMRPTQPVDTGPGERQASFIERLNRWRVSIRDFITQSGDPFAPPPEAPRPAPAPPPGQAVTVPGQGTITLPAPAPGERSVQDVMAESQRLIDEARLRYGTSPRGSGRWGRR